MNTWDDFHSSCGAPQEHTGVRRFVEPYEDDEEVDGDDGHLVSCVYRLPTFKDFVPMHVSEANILARARDLRPQEQSQHSAQPPVANKRPTRRAGSRRY